ncbi:hypothetical protein B296_00028532 [Ensete ventricosum]|uniref:Uncharacterized protein n=1 Tax=Ensete ventricosum TaxID=4639 RepID=A0A426X6J5_ENSVE|nr:hypothetical protein B296_00028532 [Ensete ventricosum]
MAQGSSLEEDRDSSKIVGDSRKACRERFAEGIRELAGNTPGDRQKKTEKLTARMSEATRLVGGLVFTQRRSMCLKKEDWECT